MRGEESQVMSVDVTYQNPHIYEEAKGELNSRDWQVGQELNIEDLNMGDISLGDSKKLITKRS